MNLDDLAHLARCDPGNMLGEIDALPLQLERAWQLGNALPLPEMPGLRRVLIAGMGGSAIGADLLAAAVSASCPLPLAVHREYGLPAWARGPETLVIACSHSGATEETLDSFRAAQEAGCRILALCTGGELEQRARLFDLPVWKFEHAGQPRAAVGWSFGLLLALFTRLGLVADPSPGLSSAVAEMRRQQQGLAASVPVGSNPAKRLAGQLEGRWVNIHAAGFLAPVARRWKGQVNELAKAGAGFEFLPEADHNALAGLVNPTLLQQTFTIFLDSPLLHPRNRLRTRLTNQAFLEAGLACEAIMAAGDSLLAQMWTALHFGDYTAYYLAMAYGVDPTPVEALQSFKAALKKE